MNKANGLSIGGFVCSILSIFIFGIILAPLGLILSLVGRSKAVQEGGKTGLATAGVVIGAICTGIMVISFLL